MENNGIKEFALFTLNEKHGDKLSTGFEKI